MDQICCLETLNLLNSVFSMYSQELGLTSLMKFLTLFIKEARLYEKFNALWNLFNSILSLNWYSALSIWGQVCTSSYYWKGRKEQT